MPDSRLTIARIATATPMGAEAYQAQIVQRASNALATAGAGAWSVRQLAVRSLRAKLPGDRRLPIGRIARASERSRALVGRALFAGDTVSHRMNLELPPSPHGDVITLHDVIAWRFPDESPPVAAAAAEARRAAAVICVSRYTASEAVDLLGIDPPHIVHNGVDDRYFDAAALSADARRSFGIPEEYVLHAGGASKRKNLEALAAAWPQIHRERPHLRLVLAGPPHPRRNELFSGIAGVVLAGRLPDDQMPGLVAGAAAVVVPSLIEGFGLPALEAMAAGVPIVAADTSALPEVVGDTGILVPPTAAGLVDGLLLATSGESDVVALIPAARARASQFTWEHSAAGHARVWAAVGAGTG